jgi:site-specific recombinase XerD
MALEAVQAQAGHASIESTRVYLHLANDWLADQYLRAAELIDADTAAGRRDAGRARDRSPVSALPAHERPSPGRHAEAEWAQIAAAAPQVAAVMRRYLRQLGTFLAPRSVDVADSALRQLARWMITEAGLAAVGDIRRDDIEDYKVWLAARPRGGGQAITAETRRQRMRTVRQFFEPIIEGD